MLLVVLEAVGSSISPVAAGTFTLNSQQRGADRGCAPTTTQMNAFWVSTPYYYWAIYIGGVNRSCSNANLNSSWVKTVLGQGWALLPTWVGLQSPCHTAQLSFAVMSTDPQTAYQQGRQEGASAYQALAPLGIGSDTPIALDLEAFDTSNATCVTAAQNFVLGWRDQLALPPAQTSGVYGSSCATDLSAYRYPRYPDFIWGAYWNDNPNTWDMACVSSGNWVNHQRHKQWQGPHWETWNGTTLDIDGDVADGPVYY